MTDNSNDKADKAPGAQDKRPRVTLELKATEIPEAGGAQKSLRAPDNGSLDDELASATGDDGLGSRQNDERSARRTREPMAAALMTHLVAGLAGGVLALIAAFYGLDRFRDRIAVLSGVTAEDLRGEINAASTRLAALEQIASKPTSPVTTTPEWKIIEQQIGKTQETLAALQSRVAAFDEKQASAPTSSATIDNADVKAAMAPLEDRIVALEAKLASVTTAQNSQKSSVAATALAVAFNNLRRAVATGRAYAAEFDTVAKLAPTQKDLSAISAHRQTGLKTAETLASDLKPLAKAALSADYGKNDDSFASRLWTEAKSVVRVRRKGEVAGDSVEAILARAEMRLRAGDLAAAIKEAETLNGEAAVIVRPWLADAKARSAADTMLDEIEAGLLASLKVESARQ